jgi:6,7-dimethyl-8-ribityllumazine synthase
VRRVASAFTPRERSGSLDAKGLRVGVICARWNPTITDVLLASALDSLASHSTREEDVFVVRVPGAFELPVAAREAIDSEKPNALIALGAIVRGETSHHDVLAHAVAGALAQLSAESGVPIGFGLLTCETMEQARDRVSKGAEAAEAAIEMANLRRRPRRR